MVSEYYGDKDSEEDKAKKGQAVSTNVAGPISAWLVLLFVALTIKFFTSSAGLGSGIIGMLSSAADFILYAPGDIILPLVIGAAIGAEVGIHSNSLRKAEVSGFMNGIYAAIVYTIGILVIYEVLSAVFASVAPSFTFLITSWLAFPILICVALSEAFAVLSYSRKVSS